MDPVKFSILIPAYKGKYLHDAIASVLVQTYMNFELIIVDDCSPEFLKPIVDSFDDQRISYYRNEKNCGAIDVVDNWNICLGFAQGDYVICMGDDDKLTPTCLADYIDIINKYPGLHVYHTRAVLIDENSDVWQIQEARPEFESGLSLWWHRWNGRGKQYIGDFLYDRVKLLERGGFYKLPLAWASDDITAVRAALPHGIANVSVPGFMYRESRFTISMSANERIKAYAATLEKSWYLNELVSTSSSDDVDTILIKLIKTNLEDHFYFKYMMCLGNDIKESPWRIVYWFRHRKTFGISFRICLKSFLGVLARRIV